MKPRGWIWIFAGIFSLSLLCLYLFSRPSSAPLVVEILQDGVLTESISLSELTHPEERTITANGKENQILLEKDGVSMLSADCPDRLCVHQGKITNPSYPIVCLPNKLVIRLKGERANLPDAIAR